VGHATRGLRATVPPRSRLTRPIDRVEAIAASVDRGTRSRRSRWRLRVRFVR